MGGLFSKNKSHSDNHASYRGYTKKGEVYSSSSGSYMYGSGNGDSRTSHRSYSASSWSSSPSPPSMEGYSVGGSKTKCYAADSLNTASNGRYGDLDSKTTPSRGYDAATTGLKPNEACSAAVVRSAAERNYAICSVKPVLSKSHSTNYRSASLNVSSDRSYSTGRYSTALARSSVATGDVDRVLTKGFSAGGDKTKRDAADRVSNSASNKRYDFLDVKSTSSTATATSTKSEVDRNYTTNNAKPVSTERHATAKRGPPSSSRNHSGIHGSDSCRRVATYGAKGRGRVFERHATANRRPPSTSRNQGVYHESEGSRRVATYGAKGGGRVDISVPLNPWEVLGLHTSGVSREAVKAAFKKKITQPVRQNRAMVSIAYHMLTSSAGRYTRIQGKDEFVVRRRDHFMLAACGHTKELTLRIDKKGNLVQERDEYGRTLLYIASKSGFYDTCKFLLEKGASVNEAQRDGSTPLHGAAYFGHALVVGLLLQHGARSDIKNNWGNSALDESATPEIRSLIQTASADDISSVAASLREKQLVLNVRLIEYQGEVIAKELTRDPRTLDAHTRAEWNGIHNTWETAWHGTRFKYLESIIQKGLLPAGSSGIKPAAGHYSLGEEHFGIANWAAAIFLSPSILYAAHACYSDRVFSESQQWCVLVKAYCKPGSYKSYDPTVFSYKPMDGEPVMPEYRIPVHEADKNVILRVESTRSVVVRSLMFVRLSFLENQDMNFDQAMKLLR